MKHKDLHEFDAELLQLDARAGAALAHESLWAEEAEARYADFLAGRTTAIEGDEVFARAFERVRKR